MKQRLDTETIALRAAKEFHDGSVVNLGMGIPTLCSLFVPEGRRVFFHSENGILGYGRPLTVEERDQWDFQLINASAQFVTRLPGMSFFDHCIAFGMITGGHVDIAVLGGLQVSEKGDLANWWIPGETAAFGGRGMGGAMDIAVGAKSVIVAMEHTTKEGTPRILKKCTYPVTAKECVDLIVTDLAVIKVSREGLLLTEVAPSWTAEEVQALTEAKMIIAEDLTEIML